MSGKLQSVEYEDVLGAMAESKFFSSAPRLHALLRFLIKATIECPSQRITQRYIAVHFLGRGPDFDPTIDPVVRVAIGRLRVALERYEAAGLCGMVRFEIPKGGYKVVIHDLTPSFDDLGTRKFLKKPIAVLPLLAGRYGGEVDSIEVALHAAFIQRLSSLGIELLSVDILDDFLSDPSQTLVSAGLKFDFELILSFRPSIIPEKQLYGVQLSHVDGSLLWSRQYSDSHNYNNNSFSAAQVDQIADDLAGHFGVLHVSSSLFHRLSIGSGYLGLIPLEDYAIYAFRKYELTLSNDWYRKAEKSLTEAVERGSNHPLVLAMLAYLTMDKYVFASSSSTEHLARGLELLSHSRRVDPKNSYVLFVDSIASLYQGDYLGLKAKCKRLTTLHSSSQFYRYFTIWADALDAQFDELPSLLSSIDVEPFSMPSWFWFAPFLEAYASQNFAGCLQAAVSFGCEDLFWSPLLKALSYWGFGSSERATHAMQHALRLNSSLVDEAEHYVSCFVIDPRLRESMLKDIGAIQDALIED